MMPHPTRVALDQAIHHVRHAPSAQHVAQLVGAAEAYRDHVDEKRRDWEHRWIEELKKLVHTWQYGGWADTFIGFKPRGITAMAYGQAVREWHEKYISEREEELK